MSTSATCRPKNIYSLPVRVVFCAGCVCAVFQVPNCVLPGCGFDLLGLDDSVFVLTCVETSSKLCRVDIPIFVVFCPFASNMSSSKVLEKYTKC